MISKRYLIIVTAVFLMMIAISGCKAPSEEGEGPAPIAVEVATVKIGEVHTKTVLSGQVKAMVEMPVLAKMPLQIVAIKANVGDEVKTGQVLVELDNKDLLEQARQAEAGLEVAKAGLPPANQESPAALSARLAQESAAADLERMEYLFQQELVSEQTMEQARVRLAGAKAQYQGILDQEKMAYARQNQAEAGLQLARSQLANATVTAPRSGVLSSLPVEVGEMANPASPIAHIVDMSQVKIDLSATEKDITHLQVGQEVKVAVASLGKEFIGKLSMVSPAADLRTRSFPVQVTVDNADLVIKPGMFAEVELNTETVSDVLVIPRSAILQEASRQVVYVVREDIAYFQEIKPGLINDHVAEVTHGISAGDSLVIKGQQYLNDGVPVTVIAGGEGS